MYNIEGDHVKSLGFVDPNTHCAHCPLFPWKLLCEQYKAGLFPTRQFEKAHNYITNLANNFFVSSIQLVTAKNKTIPVENGKLIKGFQTMCLEGQTMTGELDDRTKKVVLDYCIGLYNKHCNAYFNNEFSQLISQTSEALGLLQYLEQ